MLNPTEDEQQRLEYEDHIDKIKEFERYKQAVEMCIAAGFLKREKLEEALKFVGEFHNG